MFNPIAAVKALGPRYRYRSAETGAFVSRLFAALHPATTVRERIR